MFLQIRKRVQVGALAGCLGLLVHGAAHGQYASYPVASGGYGGGYAVAPGGWSVQGGVAPQVISPGYASPVVPYGGGGYTVGSYGAGGWSSAPAVAYRPYPSPAQQQGYREGQLYWETGIAPNRPLSPAESRGFVAGERRAANTPWQVDPARQQGYREGQIYWETGQVPNRPLTPAEAQGFRAGENRAAAGSGYPY